MLGERGPAAVSPLGVPMMKINIPSPCPNAVYESRMRDACAALLAQDAFSQSIRNVITGLSLDLPE